MPAVVRAWLDRRSLVDVQRLQGDLLATFRDDFAKYRERVHRGRLSKVLDALPRFVGRKFVAAQVDRDDRAAPAWRRRSGTRRATAFRWGPKRARPTSRRACWTSACSSSSPASTHRGYCPRKT
jgi:hypothetical protein